jgi:hypothetical protein
VRGCRGYVELDRCWAGIVSGWRSGALAVKRLKGPGRLSVDLTVCVGQCWPWLRRQPVRGAALPLASVRRVVLAELVHVTGSRT